ncbi:TetR/AcrR family transcriptional regulator [Nigerium massiliense]|uniref:TetR/AcrR family transcriptional regulator n=1 Tax=Nigerium massiliense TaxID=1522317 RepID=UPI000693B620|nr:TetR/AcrR family transcriptional regulator [Nigerium massiliense]
MDERGAKRAEILDAVLRVIAVQGMAAVSVRVVAAEAGVSAGRVQHYFATKTDLVRAAAAHLIDVAERVHVAAAGSADARAKLLDLLCQPIRQAGTSREGVGVFYAFVTAGIGDPVIGDLLAETKAGALREITRLLGEVAPGLPDPDAEAQTLLCLSDGATQNVLVGAITPEAGASCLERTLDRLVP